MQSAKTFVRHLVEICAQKGVNEVVLSPGSRNAPLIISFASHKAIKTRIIIDERSAAFVALGMAQQMRKPAILCCTSGSAALNYAPAIAEAYYQRVPLIVITADRPGEWTNQGEGQTMDQKNIYANYINKFFQLPSEPHDGDSIWYSDRLINEAINLSTYPVPGPVHINIPLREPLYEMSDLRVAPGLFEISKSVKNLDAKVWDELVHEWKSVGRKWVITGMMPPNESMKKAMDAFGNKANAAIFTETHSNLFNPDFNQSIDRMLMSTSEEDWQEQNPELVVTLGGPIISRKVKEFLRVHRPRHHWHISDQGDSIDSFQNLTRVLDIEPAVFIANFSKILPEENQAFKKWWMERNEITRFAHHSFLEKCVFSDLKAFDIILNNLPEDIQIQMGNSTPVRYIQLFDQKEGVQYFANRGLSGIDGTLSTAVGAAYKSKAPVLMIVGDLGFLYDINALWNDDLPENIKVIVINNGGGSIFRIIPGPDSTPFMEDYFETKHNRNLKKIGEAYGLKYHAADNEEDLKKAVKNLLNQTGPAILEVHTPREINDKILKDYFESIKIKIQKELPAFSGIEN